jgi:hypothetical protein
MVIGIIGAIGFFWLFMAGKTGSKRQQQKKKTVFKIAHDEKFSGKNKLLPVKSDKIKGQDY